MGEGDSAFAAGGIVVVMALLIWVNSLNDKIASLRGAIGNTSGIYSASLNKPIDTDLIMDITSDSNKTYVEPTQVTINPKSKDEDYNSITVRKVLWPDGGYSTFSNCAIAGSDETTGCMADNGAHQIYQFSLHHS